MKKENHPGFVRRHRASFWLCVLSYPIAYGAANVLCLVGQLLRNFAAASLPRSLTVLRPLAIDADTCILCLVIALNALAALLFANKEAEKRQ